MAFNDPDAQRAYNREYLKNHREQIYAQNKASYLRHRPERLEAAKSYYQTHKEQAKIYHENHKEQRLYRLVHPPP